MTGCRNTSVGVGLPHFKGIEVMLDHPVVGSGREFRHGIQVERDAHRVAVAASRVLIDGQDAVVNVVAEHLADAGVRVEPGDVRQHRGVVLPVDVSVR